MKRFFPFVLLLLAGCTFSVKGDTLYVDWMRSIPRVDPRVEPQPKPVDPITTKEFRCLIVEEVTQRPKLPKLQFQMIMANGDKSVRDFLQTNCVKETNADGSIDEGFRIVDKSEALDGIWAELAKKYPAKSYPWLILSNGPTGEGLDLPREWSPMETLLNKYAGVK